MWPSDASIRAQSFRRMSQASKDAIIAEIAALSGSAQQRTIQDRLRRGGVAAEFISHILSKRAPIGMESPNDKASGPVQTK